MLYLLESPGKNNKTYYKIGFATNFSNRFSQYKHYNPDIKCISTREGSRIEEGCFHLYLNSLGFSLNHGSSREWYVSDPKIKEIFDKIDINDLYEILWKQRELYFTDNDLSIYYHLLEFKGFGNIINLDLNGTLTCTCKMPLEKFDIKRSKYHRKFIILDGVGNNKFKELKTFLTSYPNQDILKLSKESKEEIEKVQRYLISYYPSLLLDFESLPKTDLDKIIIDFYSGTSNFEIKMKEYCELAKNDSCFRERMNNTEFEKYFSYFGAEGCKAVGFKEASLKAKLIEDTIFNTSNINQVVYSEFKVGDKLTRKEIKEKLKKIYQQFGVKKSATAEDIGRWFGTERCQSRVNGKKVGGLKLIKKK